MDDQLVEIVVGGAISPDVVATALHEFTVTRDGPARTRVVGRVPDQARLFGLLAVFDGLHISVISVNPVADEPRPHG